MLIHIYTSASELKIHLSISSNTVPRSMILDIDLVLEVKKVNKHYGFLKYKLISIYP